MFKRAADVCVCKFDPQFDLNHVRVPKLSDAWCYFAFSRFKTVISNLNSFDGSGSIPRFHHIERDKVTGIMLPAVIIHRSEPRRTFLSWRTFEGGITFEGGSVAEAACFDDLQSPYNIKFELPWPRPKSQTHYWTEADEAEAHFE